MRKRTNNIAAVFAIAAAIGLETLPLTAADAIIPDLKKIAQGVGAKSPKPEAVRWVPDAKGRPALFANTAIWLDDLTFSEGVIECDILGKSAPRGSNFLGIGFHGLDDATFECIYFRPFNFRADNELNAAHAVQYISHPDWTWQKLRAEKTGQFEKPILPPPNGDEWFHVKIVVTDKKVSAFVNNAAKPSLEVERLSKGGGGRIAIWGGDAGDGGHFANFKILPATN